MLLGAGGRLTSTDKVSNSSFGRTLLQPTQSKRGILPVCRVAEPALHNSHSRTESQRWKHESANQTWDKRGVRHLLVTLSTEAAHDINDSRRHVGTHQEANATHAFPVLPQAPTVLDGSASACRQSHQNEALRAPGTHME